MKNFKSLLTVILALFLVSTLSNAQVAKVTTLNNSNEPLKVKYLGSEDSFLYFQVTANNMGSTFSQIKIYDKIDGEIFSQNFKYSNYVQNFKIEKRENQELNFKISFGNKVYSKTFSTIITTIEKVVENDVVLL